LIEGMVVGKETDLLSHEEREQVSHKTAQNNNIYNSLLAFAQYPNPKSKAI
jgi:hypothetical protein